MVGSLANARARRVHNELREDHTTGSSVAEICVIVGYRSHTEGLSAVDADGRRAVGGPARHAVHEGARVRADQLYRAKGTVLAQNLQVCPIF